LEQLEEVIEKIRRLMLRSAQEVVSKGKLSRRKPTREAGKKQQQRQSNGADGQIQRIVWDPGGFQQQSGGAHEIGAHDSPNSGV
jgi:hypothetical protein